MVLVTIGPDGALLDRRRVDLTEPGLPTRPYVRPPLVAPGPEDAAGW